MRSRIFPFFIALLLTPLGAVAQVFISEIMYDLPDPGGDTGREWVEIQNIGTTAVDMIGWKFFEANANHNLVIAQGNNMLPPGAYAVIVEKPEKFLAEHVGFSGTIFDSAFSLNNTDGESLALKDPQGLLVGDIFYRPSWGAKGDGTSLQYFPDGWSASLPTPGSANIKSVPQPKVLESKPVQEPVTQKEVLQTKQNESVSLEEEAPLSNTSEPVVLDISDTAFQDNSSRLVWWLLLGGVIIVAGSAYWIGGRSEGEEYTIIEEKSSE